MGFRSTLIVFPGALGDFLCCWPSLAVLGMSTGEVLTLVAREVVAPLLPADRISHVSIDRREVADLFGSAPLTESTRRLFSGFSRVHSWTGYGNDNFAERLRAATGAAVSVHPFRALRPGEHAVEYFARCLNVTPLAQPLTARSAARGWAQHFWLHHGLGDRTLVLHPGSGSPRKNWEGMSAIARLWRDEAVGQVVLLAGPAETGPTNAVWHDAAVRSQRLDRVAAVLSRAHCYLGNDSGISHLAGIVGARGVVAFGPTDPVAWGPRGATLRVVSAPEPCQACGHGRLCVHRLPVGRVWRELARTI